MESSSKHILGRQHHCSSKITMVCSCFLLELSAKEVSPMCALRITIFPGPYSEKETNLYDLFITLRKMQALCCSFQLDITIAPVCIS